MRGAFLARLLPVMQGGAPRRVISSMSSAESRDGLSTGRLIRFMFALWLAGVAMRMTILAMPPVIPLVHAELNMSETQVGLLIGMPLAMFAIAAIPGSLLISRIGTRNAVVFGMIFAAFASASRGLSIDVWTLYLASILTGFGVAVMQPGLPTLVREWLPTRMALGTISFTGGMLIGSMFSAALTIPFVLPFVGGSWRIDLVVWAVFGLLIVPIFLLLSPRSDAHPDGTKRIGGRWWPDFKDPLVWLLGIAFGSNNSPFFSTNAFLGDYLASEGKSALLGSALAWLNTAQIVAPFMLLFMSERLQRRAWPFIWLGPLLLLAFIALIYTRSDAVIIICAALIGLTTAITLTAILALPPVLSTAADLPRTSAGMFTISYTTAIIVPTISGALWDMTGKPWTVFVPLCICAVVLTVLGVVAARYPTPSERGIASS
jgi:MFS transporter, CP family, cyanate transporter